MFLAWRGIEMTSQRGRESLKISGRAQIILLRSSFTVDRHYRSLSSLNVLHSCFSILFSTMI
jgi:hypothetical protein